MAVGVNGFITHNQPGKKVVTVNQWLKFMEPFCSEAGTVAGAGEK